MKGRTHARLWLALGLAAIGPSAADADLTGSSGAPSYTAAGLVHAATQLSQTLAPNTIATLYGTNLAFSTVAVASGDLTNGTMPTSLGQVTVYVNNIPASLFYISPTQINFLIPYTITSASASIYVSRQGTVGPIVTAALASAAPAFFVWNNNLALAVHLDGSLVSPAAPAHPAEVITMFAGGLGRTSPDLASGDIATTGFPILALAQFQVLVNGVALPPASVLYAGIAPGFAGLYQINLRLPDTLVGNPTIRIAIGMAQSPAGVLLPTG